MSTLGFLNNKDERCYPFSRQTDTEFGPLYWISSILTDLRNARGELIGGRFTAFFKWGPRGGGSIANNINRGPFDIRLITLSAIKQIILKKNIYIFVDTVEPPLTPVIAVSMDVVKNRLFLFSKLTKPKPSSACLRCSTQIFLWVNRQVTRCTVALYYLLLCVQVTNFVINLLKIWRTRNNSRYKHKSTKREKNAFKNFLPPYNIILFAVTYIFFYSCWVLQWLNSTIAH